MGCGRWAKWGNDFVTTESISRDEKIYAINNERVVETLIEGLANPVGVGFIGGYRKCVGH